MTDQAPYFPQALFAAPGEPPPRVMIAPPRYIQGPGVLANSGKYLSLINARRAGVLASRRGHTADAAAVVTSLEAHDVQAVTCTFEGECSLPEIERHVQALAGESLDCLLAVGGGKCVDAGKCIAWRLGIPVVVIPTLASNDAPTSALSVLHSPEGVSQGAEFFPDNPAMVIVDTRVIAQAMPRQLVAGIGDAMATWFEARVCLNNEAARTTVGARPTLASAAIGEICARTLFADGEAAIAAVVQHEVNDALERVVEANTLLSGLGFESGGLALAHALANSYTVLHHVHEQYLHGEMVAMGTLAQLALEDMDEARRVAEFFARIGLPVHLAQLSISEEQTDDLCSVAETAAASPIAHNMPMKIDVDVVHEAMMSADRLGHEVAARVGDDAWRGYHV